MKVIFNGNKLACRRLVVQGHNVNTGWAIGLGEECDNLIRKSGQCGIRYAGKEIVPLFYDRGRDGIPRDW
jgi:starch phosphorylase